MFLSYIPQGSCKLLKQKHLILNFNFKLCRSHFYCQNVLGDAVFLLHTGLLLFSNSNNVLDATKAFSLVLTDPEDVLGLPESLLLLTAEAAAVDVHTDLKESRFTLFF